MAKHQIAILDDYQNIALKYPGWEEIKQDAEITVFNKHFEPEELAKVLEPFDAIVAMRERTAFPEALLKSLPRLKFITTTGNGNRSIDMAAAATHSILISAAPGSKGSHLTAELTWTLILAAQKNLVEEYNNVKNGGWQTTVGASGLYNLTLGIIGLGKIGQIVANIGKAFGMRVVAWSQNLNPQTARAFGIAPMESKEALLRESDVVSLHLVSSARTYHILDREALGNFKQNALLVNTSRGPLVDQDALLEALQQKRIRAGLDVFDVEPLPVRSPFRSIDSNRLVITPHIGYSSTDNYEAFYINTMENIQAWIKGQPIRIVTAETPYL